MDARVKTPGDGVSQQPESRRGFFQDGEDTTGPATDGDDPLLACLEFIARQYGKPVSRAAAVAGLPLRRGRLTVDLAPRAASRLGLNVRLVERDVAQVPGLVIPFIVLFRNGDACVVVGKQRRRVRVVFPQVSDKARHVALSQIEKDASGHLFYVTGAADEDGGRGAKSARTGLADRGHWLWSAVWRFWPSWVQIVVAALVINLLGLAFPLFIMNVYDRVIPNLAIPTLVALAAGVGIAVLFDFVLKQLRAVVLDQTGRRVDMKVASRLFEHALGISMAEKPGSSGAIANQIREFELVRDFFTSSSIIAITDLLFIGVFIGVLWLIAGPIALVPLLAVPIVLAVTLFVQIPLARSVALTQQQGARRHGILVESLVGIETIKAVAGEGVMQRKWEEAVAATARANSSTRFWSSFANYFTLTVQQAVGIVVIFWGVFLVADGTITVGALIAANILGGRVLAPLGSIAQTFARAQQAFAAMRGLNAFMNLKEERPGAIGSGQRVEHGAIAFRDVHFAYPGAGVDTLRGVTFSIAPGERVGIIGRVGSGKTTLGRLMAGFYETDKGSVLVDGVDIRHFEPAELRNGVGFVSQDSELFTGTLRDNIVLGNPLAGEDEIARAVRASGVESFSATHQLGLAMPIGERGRGLSGGQRQAVALARMLLRRPKVLFLDEPSSAMDTNTESVLIEQLRTTLGADETLIVCTHRGSFLDIVDRLLVVEGGRIVADGPKQAVLDALRGQALRRDGSAGSEGDRP
jgi:ATP-binding cassette, subfamily C, bacterial LapB